MFKNRKYGAYTVFLCLTCFGYMFLAAFLEEQTDILRRFITPADTGWTAGAMELPAIAGRLLAVPMAFVCMWSFLRFGVRRTLIPCAAAAALGCGGLICANGLDACGGVAAGHYWLFCPSLALTLCACAMLRLAVAALCVGWAIRCRGRVLGTASLGGPVFAAVGAGAVAELVAVGLGGDCRPLYLAAMVLLALLALSTRFLLRERPEDAGLYPDGEGRAPACEPEDDPPPMKVSRLLLTRGFWIILLGGGAVAAGAAGSLGTVQMRLALLGGEALADAAPWLAFGAILTIPACYIFGWLDDRLGSAVTMPLLGLGSLLPSAALWAMPAGGNAALFLLLSLGIGWTAGGLPVCLPCAVAHVYGRPQYLAAARVLLPALTIPATLVPLAAAWLLDAGRAGTAYTALLAASAGGVLMSLLLITVKDPRRKPQAAQQ